MRGLSEGELSCRATPDGRGADACLSHPSKSAKGGAAGHYALSGYAGVDRRGRLRYLEMVDPKEKPHPNVAKSAPVRMGHPTTHENG
jgi:hypothetical protein